MNRTCAKVTLMKKRKQTAEVNLKPILSILPVLVYIYKTGSVGHIILINLVTIGHLNRGKMGEILIDSIVTRIETLEYK